MPNSVSIPFSRKKVHEAKGFDEIDSLQHEKAAAQNARLLFVLQHRKRYGLHAIIRWMSHSQSRIRFQYRKRYGLHAIRNISVKVTVDRSFQYRKRYGLHAIPTTRFHALLNMFQYRKRYGLHAISRPSSRGLRRFNTASGMDCMQLLVMVKGETTMFVSIPQAVWIACNLIGSVRLSGTIGFNTASGMDCMQ